MLYNHCYNTQFYSGVPITTDTVTVKACHSFHYTVQFFSGI